MPDGFEREQYAARDEGERQIAEARFDEPTCLRRHRLFEIIRVDRRVVFPPFRHVCVGVDGLDRAGRDTGSAIDAHLGVDVELRIPIGTMDAVDRTNVDARLVFCADARFGDHVAHGCIVIFCGGFAL